METVLHVPALRTVLHALSQIEHNVQPVLMAIVLLLITLVFKDVQIIVYLAKARQSAQCVCKDTQQIQMEFVSSVCQAADSVLAHNKLFVWIVEKDFI